MIVKIMVMTVVIADNIITIIIIIYNHSLSVSLSLLIYYFHRDNTIVA